MNKVISPVTFAMLAITLSQPLAYSQEFISSSARRSSPSFDHFTMSLEATAGNMARAYDERTEAIARSHWLGTDSSNMTNLGATNSAYGQSNASQVLSQNGSNQGGFNQGNNQGNNGFFGGGFPGGLGGFGLPLFTGSLFDGGLFDNPNPSVEPRPGRFTRTAARQANRTAVRTARQNSGPF